MIIREKCESLYLKTFQMYLSNWEWYTTNQLQTPVTGIIFPDILQTNNFPGTLNLFQGGFLGGILLTNESRKVLVQE